MESVHYDELPDSLIGSLSFGVEYDIEDDSTLSCTVPFLEYETSYTVIANNLWVINGVGDTIQVPSATIAFTTVLPPHGLVTSSIAYHNDIRCTDTLIFQFNRALDSVSAGDIITVFEFDPLDTNLVETQVTSTSWFDASDQIIYTTVPNMVSGKGYRAFIELQNITGDSTSDRSFPFSVKSAYKLALHAVSQNPGQPLSSQPDWYPARSGNFEIGDNIPVYAPQRVGNHLFSHWNIPEIPSLDGSTSPGLTISLDCETVTNVHAEAVYRPMLKDTIEVSAGSHGTVAVYSGRGQYLGGQGDYILYEGESIMVSIKPDSSYHLFKWVMNDTSNAWSISSAGGNNASAPVLIVTFDPPATYQSAYYSPLVVSLFTAAPSAVFGTTGSVVISEEYGVPQNQIAVFFGSGGNCTNGPWSSTCTATQKGIVKSYSVGILDPCFEIYRIDRYTRDGNGNMVLNTNVIANPVSNFTMNLKTDDPYEQVTFYVRRKRFAVQVEEKMTSGTDSPLNDRNWASIILPVTVGNATPPLPTALNTNAGMTLIGNNPQQLNVINPSNLNDTRKYYVLCGSDVTFEAKAEEAGVNFDEWYCGAGYTCDPDDQFQVTITGDTKVQAVFGDNFRIVEIGLYQGSATQVTWFSPDAWITPEDIHILGNQTTDVIVRFSQSVNTQSVQGYLTARDNSDRLDYDPQRRYTNCGSCMTFAPYNGHNDAQVTFSLKDGLGRHVLKLLDVNLDVSQLIRSDLNVPLEGYGVFKFRTELPRVKVTFNKLEIDNESDGDEGWFSDGGEIYNLWSVIHADGSGVVSDIGGQSPPAAGGDDPGGDPGIWNLDEGETEVIGNVLMLTPKVRRDAVIRAELITRERDNMEFFNRLQNFFTELGNIATEINGQIEEDVDDPATASDESQNTVKDILQAVPIITRGIDAVLTLIGGKTTDAGLGHKIWLYDISNWWGAHRSVRGNNDRIRSHHVYYTVDFELQ